MKILQKIHRVPENTLYHGQRYRISKTMAIASTRLQFFDIRHVESIPTNSPKNCHANESARREDVLVPPSAMILCLALPQARRDHARRWWRYRSRAVQIDH